MMAPASGCDRNAPLRLRVPVRLRVPGSHARRAEVPDAVRGGSEVVGTFPNETAMARLFGAILLEQSDERPPSDRAT
jgi:hypothetical protein